MSLAMGASTARAQIGSARYAAIITEARSGTVLMAASADEQRYPASLTKMMTVYMALEGLREGRFQRGSLITVSGTAAAMPPSRLGLTAGMQLTVEEAIIALVTKSANDAAAALGEYIGGGSEQRFAQMMTMRARQLGMTRTTFRNASGLPDYDQVTTARDMALLGRRLIQDFPRDYAYFSTPHFVFRGRTHWNHNRLLQEYDGTDGIKTGYVNDSGFNLVASTQRDGVRLVAAVFGGRTGRERDRHMMAILDQSFAQMGIAPRAPMAPAPAPTVMAARRGFGTGLVGTAQAAARPAAATAIARRQAPHQGRAVAVAQAAPPRAAARPVLAQAPGRQPQLRLVATTPPGRAARVEQGDTSGRARAAQASRSLAPKPVTTAAAAPRRPRT
jgi:D-alanyl-D-alanine carboxypeptidase